MTSVDHGNDLDGRGPMGGIVSEQLQELGRATSRHIEETTNRISRQLSAEQRRIESSIGDMLRMYSNPELNGLLSYISPDDRFKAFDRAGVDREAAYAAVWAVAEYWGARNVPEQMTLGFGDVDLEQPAEDERTEWETSITGVEQGAIRYLGYVSRPTRGDDGRLHLEIAAPEGLEESTAAETVAAQWSRAEACMDGDPMGTALELAKALQATAELERLHTLFAKRGTITPLWDYVYDLDRNDPEGWGPDPFMGTLPVILGAINGDRQPVTEKLARGAAEHVRPGTWETVRRAVRNIREDYKAALLYANGERPELKESLGDVDATLDRYEALREAARTPWAAELREAVLSHRHEGERANAETGAAIVRYMPDHVEIEAGQGPRPLMEMVLDAIAKDADVGEAKYQADLRGNGHKEDVTYRVIVPKPARELIRKLPREDRTVSGLMSYLATWCQVVRDVAAETPGDGPVKVSAEMVVRARANTRGTRFVAREYKGRVKDARDAIDAMSYMHVEATFPTNEGRGRVRGPLIAYLSMMDETDPQGHTTRNVWAVPRNLPGFLGEAALAHTEHSALPNGNPYRQIDSAMRQYLMDQADRFYRTGLDRMPIKAAEVVNMGRKEPPMGTNETRYKIQLYELVRVPEAYDRVLPDVIAALRESGREPVRFMLRYEEMKPTEKMKRRRRVTGLVISKVDDWNAALRRHRR